jgi:hypothetical protein
LGEVLNLDVKAFAVPRAATIKSLARELILGPTALRIDAVLAAVKAWPGGRCM